MGIAQYPGRKQFGQFLREYHEPARKRHEAAEPFVRKGITFGPHTGEPWRISARDSKCMTAPWFTTEDAILATIVLDLLRAAHKADEMTGRHAPGMDARSWYMAVSSKDKHHLVKRWSYLGNGQFGDIQLDHVTTWIRLPNLAPARCWPDGKVDFEDAAAFFTWELLGLYLDRLSQHWYFDPLATPRHQAENTAQPVEKGEWVRGWGRDPLDTHISPVPFTRRSTKVGYACEYTALLLADDPWSSSDSWPNGVVPPPSFETKTSKRKYQVLWRLEEPVLLDEARNAKAWLCSQLGADHAAVAATHTFRRPGSFSAKRQFLTKIITEEPGRVYNIEEFKGLSSPPFPPRLRTEVVEGLPANKGQEALLEGAAPQPPCPHGNPFVTKSWSEACEDRRSNLRGQTTNTPSLQGATRSSRRGRYLSVHLERRLVEGYGYPDRSSNEAAFVLACVSAQRHPSYVYQRMLRNTGEVGQKLREIHARSERQAYAYFMSQWEWAEAFAEANPPAPYTPQADDLLARLTPVIRSQEEPRVAEFLLAVLEQARRCRFPWPVSPAGIVFDLETTYEQLAEQLADILGVGKNNIKKMRIKRMLDRPDVQRYVEAKSKGVWFPGRRGLGSVLRVSIPASWVGQAGIPIPTGPSPELDALTEERRLYRVFDVINSY